MLIERIARSLAAAFLLVAACAPSDCLASQSGPSGPRPPTRLDEIRLADDAMRAIATWADCSGGRALELAAGDRSADQVADEVQRACVDHERLFETLLVRDFGAEFATSVMAHLRSNTRQRLLRTIAEARGASRERPAGTEFLAWGECAGSRTRQLSLSDATVERIVDEVLLFCRPQEQAVRALIERQDGAQAAELFMPTHVRHMQDQIRRFVAESRTVP